MNEDLADPATVVPASEFFQNFEQYRRLAEREPVAISSQGEIKGYFLSADDYAELRRFMFSRRSFATRELPAGKVAAIAASRMDLRHAHLDALLDPE